MVYCRWRDAEGREFPFSPHTLEAHMSGLDFIGPLFMLSKRGLRAYAQARFRGLSPQESLRFMAKNGLTFMALDDVLYTRAGDPVAN